MLEWVRDIERRERERGLGSGQGGGCQDRVETCPVAKRELFRITWCNVTSCTTTSSTLNHNLIFLQAKKDLEI